MTIRLNCASCGNNQFEYPVNDDDPVLCQSCGESLGSLASVKERVAEEVVGRREG